MDEPSGSEPIRQRRAPTGRARRRPAVGRALAAAAMLALAGAGTVAAAQAPHGSQGAQGAVRDSGSSRHLQLRADPPPPPPQAQPFGYPGVPAGGTRRVIIVQPQPSQQPLPGAQPVQSQPALPPAQLSREADPREVSQRALRADPAPPPAQPFGYPPANAGRVIIIAPAPTQSFSDR